MEPNINKQVYKTGILIVALVIISISCEKDELLRIPEEEGLTVEQAVHFVELQKVNQFTLKSGGQQMQSINIMVDWDKAKCSSNKNVWVVETLIKGEGRFGFATAENMRAWKSTGNRAFISSMSRLVVTKEKKSGEIHSFIMSIAGEKQYIEMKNFRLWDNTYLKRDKELSGYVFFHTLSGQFVNGWIYCDGKITNTVIDASNLDLTLQLKSTAEMAIYEWVEYCTDYYTIGWVDGEVVSFRQTGSSCSVVLEYAGSYSSGGSEDSGGGGYLPSSDETTCDCDICPVCGGCIQGVTLKRLPLPGSGETSPTSGDCPVCHCLPIVDTSDLTKNPKALCVYEHLMHGGVLQDFISRYFGPSEPNHSFLGELNLTWVLGNSTETTPIGVAGNGRYSVVISLNETSINNYSTTNLAISMLHEALHAKLIAEFYDDIGSTDFQKLYKYYQGWDLGDIDKIQERQMFQDYLDELASALQSFDRDQNIIRPLDFYLEALKYDFSVQLGMDIYQQGYEEFLALLYDKTICH